MNVMRIAGYLLCAFAIAVTVYTSAGSTATQTPELYSLVIENHLDDTAAQNSVTAVYLNYRIFDTIFEALMLLISVMGVIHFSRHENNRIYFKAEKPKDGMHFGRTIALVIPVIMIMGFYLTVNGHLTPGGGFQGGAALSAVLICVYLLRPEKSINFRMYEKIEKVLFLLILLFATVFAVSALYLSYTEFNIIYMVIMNSLIAAKVFCGLTIIFFRFVHYEDS